MVRQPLTPKRVTVEVEKLSTPKKLATPKKEKPRTPKKEQLSPKKEEIHYDENSGQWAEGLSKGVYVHKVSSRRGVKREARSPARGKKKRGRMNRNGEVGTGETEGSSLLAKCLESRSQIGVAERVESYNLAVVETEEAVKEIQEEIFTMVFDSIVNFVETAAAQAGALIPTAVLLTGVNMPDHSNIFNLLLSKMESVSPHTSLVGPGLNLRSLVTQIVSDLTSDEDEEGVKKSEASISTLASWYAKRYSKAARPPLVIIIQQFEAMAAPAMQDLILLLSRHPSLPVVFVFGVATSLATLHTSLAQAATSHLTFHTFGSPPATSCLDKVVERVLINTEQPFKLDYRVFQFLIENFLYHDFAVRHFMEGWKFILGEHYYRHPSSLLCCPKSVRTARLESMSDRELDSIRRLPSFRKHVETLDLEKQAELLTCEKTVKKEIAILLESLQHQVELFTCMSHCLHHLACDLPRRPLGRTIRVTYELCLSGRVTTSQQFKEAWRYLQLSNRAELCRKVGLVLGELSKLESPAQAVVDLTTFLNTSLTKMEAMAEVVEDEEESVPPSPAVTALKEKLNSLPPSLPSSLPPSGISSLASTPVVNTGLPSRLDRHSLKASLDALKEGQQRETKVRPFDILRTEVTNELLAALNKHLTPPSSLPLHEVTTFTSLAAVKRHLVGAPRAALHTALTQPGEYLRNPDLNIDDPGEIPNTFPDLAIGYKLHLECSKLINVFDWLTCWNQIVTGEEDEHQEIPAKQQARFSRVVAELQMLGFIRTSNKKTDHVARLTFGGS